MGELPVSACGRIIRNATNMRVGRDAAVVLAEMLEEIGEEIASEAGKLAKHAKRKTVKASDIKLAVK
ncbi:histone family protein [Candidatus Pyrohabitans sp.]|jgi:histone H3/H4